MVWSGYTGIGDVALRATKIIFTDELKSDFLLASGASRPLYILCGLLQGSGIEFFSLL